MTIRVPTAPPLSWVAPRMPIAGPGEGLVALHLRAGDPRADPLVAAVERLVGPDDPRDEGREEPQVVGAVVVIRLLGTVSIISRNPPYSCVSYEMNFGWSTSSSFVDVQALEDRVELEVAEVLRRTRPTDRS